MRHLGLLTLLLPIFGSAQNMVLDQGTITVGTGTQVTINGPVTWTITGTAQLQNDGEIHLYNGAALSEAPGSPAYGGGTEHSHVTVPAIMTGTAPGGLGLELTSTAALAPFELVRGHLPLTMGSGQQSIARWFQLIGADNWQLEQMTLLYDPSELNGLAGSTLGIFDADQPSSPWVPMWTTHTGNEALSSYGVHPRAYITAFHEDAATTVIDHRMEAIAVFPTLMDDIVHIKGLSDRPMPRLQLHDAAGKLLPLTISRYADRISLDVSGLSPGIFLLSVNDKSFKLVKQ